MVLASEGAMAMSPIESAVPSRSKTGVQVTPLLTVLNTPPDAVPTKMIDGLVATASMSSMRPPNDAGPMCRQRRCSSASGLDGVLWLCACPFDTPAAAMSQNHRRNRRDSISGSSQISDSYHPALLSGEP